MSGGVIRPAFTATRLEEERAQDVGKVFTVRLNEKDLEVLRELKGLWGVDSDSGAMRYALHLSRNVIRSQFGDGLAEALFKKKRLRG